MRAPARQIWRYEHKPSIASPIYCCGPNNRGVAISEGTVYMATLDARLLALDAATGKVKWDIEVSDPEAGYSQTMAPLIIDNMVIIGTSGAEYGIRGFVRAYDKNDGHQIWNFYTLPDKGWEGNFAERTNEGEDLKRNIAAEKAAMAQYGDAWQRGGGSVWMTPAYDPASHMIYFAVGNPSPDLDGCVRPGDNLYTESVVAIDARSGEYKWHYQEVPHDVWDLDAVSPPVLVTLKDGTKARGAGRQDGVGLRLERRDRQAHPPLRRVQPSRGVLLAADGRRRSHAARRERRFGVVADGREPRARLHVRPRASSSR